jgi:predicted phosphoribosyltransferase
MERTIDRVFEDRSEAGYALARNLVGYANRRAVLVLALPRGGVPVAYEVARALNAPLDVLNVRKLCVPGYEALAMGALATGDLRVINRSVVRRLRIPDEVIEMATANAQEEFKHREQLYREGRPAPQVTDRIVILVDDGLATGSTMVAAVWALRRQKPTLIVVAMPVASILACLRVEAQADEMICLMTPEPFYGVGAWYVDFPQTTPEEVRELLARPNVRAVRHETTIGVGYEP